MSRATWAEGRKVFKTEMIRLGSQTLRVGRHAGGSGGIPLLVFNGIGGNIELLAPLARSMPDRELLTEGEDKPALVALFLAMVMN